MHLVGLVGRAGAGKDTVAEMIGRRVRIARFAFADALKAELADAYLVDPRLFSLREGKELHRRRLALNRCGSREFRQRFDSIAPGQPLSPRWVMQQWGDMMRERDPEHYVWPAVVARAAAINSAADMLVVTDVRFVNEADWITRNGGLLWRIVRDGAASADRHPSETTGDGLPLDAVIRNDGTLEDLERTVADLVGQVMEARDAA